MTDKNRQKGNEIGDADAGGLAKDIYARQALSQARSSAFDDCIFAIRGAIAFGIRGTNAPPDGHWLAEFYDIGKKLARPAPEDSTLFGMSVIVDPKIAPDTFEIRPAPEALGAAGVSEADILALLPGCYYMDPPDGGSVTLLEQLQRMARDAARYRWLRDSERVGEEMEGDILVGAEGGEDILWGKFMDRAIDAAMAGESIADVEIEALLEARAENTAAIAANYGVNSQRAEIIARAVFAHGRHWPEQLTSGVMFYEGERITKAEFMAEVRA